MKVRHLNHIGINVENLEAAKLFFTDLGFTVMGETTMEGNFVESIIGLKDVKSTVVMLEAPDKQINIELSKFHHPLDNEGLQANPANKLGLRHIAFEVNDLESIVSALQKNGTELIGQMLTYEDSWKLCYVRGPEGVIVELAEELSKEK